MLLQQTSKFYQEVHTINISGTLWYDLHVNCSALQILKQYRGVSGGQAGWAIAHPVFGRLEGATRQRRRAALLLAHPDLGSQLRPCNMSDHFGPLKKLLPQWLECFYFYFLNSIRFIFMFLKYKKKHFHAFPRIKKM